MNIDKTERLYSHYKDRSLFLKAAHLADAVAKAEGLELNAFQPKSRLNECSARGLCYSKSKTIAIVIRHRQDKQDGGEWSKDPLPWEDIESTTLHEVAHLKHADHSIKFWSYLRYLVDVYADHKEHSFKNFPKKYNKLWQLC